MRDSKSHLLQDFRGSHDLIKHFRADSFSAGKRAIWLTESTSTVAGPSHFPGWRGRPSCLQAANAIARLCAHSGESGGPAVMPEFYASVQESTPPGLRLN